MSFYERPPQAPITGQPTQSQGLIVTYSGFTRKEEGEYVGSQLLRECKPNFSKQVTLTDPNKTCGVLELLDVRTMWQCIHVCYQDVLAIAPSDLCIVHLVFAIGSATASVHKVVNDKNSPVVEAVDSTIEANISFQVAEAMLSDLSEPGQPDVWVIQAFALCTIYHLTFSKRNLAEECHSESKLICHVTMLNA